MQVYYNALTYFKTYITQFFFMDSIVFNGKYVLERTDLVRITTFAEQRPHGRLRATPLFGCCLLIAYS